MYLLHCPEYNADIFSSVNPKIRGEARLDDDAEEEDLGLEEEEEEYEELVRHSASTLYSQSNIIARKLIPKI